MIRFIDLGKQIALDENDSSYPREFAFYNTISDQFLRINSSSVFGSWDDFEENAKLHDLSLEMIERCRRLCPLWVFGEDIVKQAEQQHKESTNQ